MGQHVDIRQYSQASSQNGTRWEAFLDLKNDSGRMIYIHHKLLNFLSVVAISMRWSLFGARDILEMGKLLEALITL